MINIKLERTIYDYIDLDEIKNYLRISHNNDDKIIKLCLEAASDFVQEYCSYILVQAIVAFTVENYKRDLLGNKGQKEIDIPYKPATKLIDIIDEDENKITGRLAGDKIIVDNNIFRKIAIIYKAGNENIPADLKLALYRITSDMYFNRTMEVKITSDILELLNKHRLIYV